MWVPVAIVVGLALAAWAHWYVDSQGLAGDPAPDALWIWTGLTGFAIGVAILGWRRTGWWRRAASLAAVPLCLLTTAHGSEHLGRVLPHRAGRLEPADRWTAARRNGPGHHRRDADGGDRAVPRQRGEGGHPRHRVGVQAPNRTRLPSTEVVRHQSPAQAAGRDDDRGRVQHPGRLAPHRKRRGDRRQPRPGARRQRAGAGVRRLRWVVQQRHRVRQRRPRQRRRPPDQGCRALRERALRHQPQPRRLGNRRLVDGRHVCGRSDRDASRTVQQFRRHRRRHGTQRRHHTTRRWPASTVAMPTRGHSSTRRR